MGICQSKEAAVIVQTPPEHEEAKPVGTTQAKVETTKVPVERAEPSALNPTNSSDTSKSAASGVSEKGARSQPGYSSGGSTPMDTSHHSTSALGQSSHNNKSLMNSSSVLGLDKLIDDRKIGGDLKNNIVHMEVPFGKPIEEVYDGVHDGPVLGSGISGLVRLCTHMATGAKYAVKCLDLGLVETDEGVQQLREEIAIMCQLDHPNIVRLEEVYESHSEIYLVQELCVGGELFDRLDEQPDYHYTESQCAKLVKQMLCSVRYCHSKGIIHRDLKLENFLFSNEDADSELKMIDFGLSKHFKYGEVQHEAVGTPYTVAPEVIRGTYDERCDVWAIGVITYLLLSGDPPFGGCGGPESLMQVRSNILAGRFQFEPTEIWQHVSQDAKDFILELLVTDPNNRPTAKHCQKSQWLREWASKNASEEDNCLNTNVVKALVNFKEYSDMRKLLCEVLSFTLLPDQITDLRKEFEKFDIDGSGEISLKALKQVLMQGAGSGSLGALTEEEIEDIFNAMRVRKSETRIHWHEFIAAGLSQCKVDDRNLRLAFERLDADHKGFVTFDNIMDLMGKDGAESEVEMRQMWASSMTSCQCSEGQVTFEDFLVLMKGQTVPKDAIHPPQNGMVSILQPSSGLGSILQPDSTLGTLHEISDCHSNEDAESSAPTSPQTTKPLLASENMFRRLSGTGQASADFPPHSSPTFDDDDEPFTMDADDDKMDEFISQSADVFMATNVTPMKSSFTPPQSPKRSPMDHVTPNANGHRFDLNSNSLVQLTKSLPPLPDTLDFSRQRSKSVDDSDRYANEAEDKILADTRRSMFLPEHTHDAKAIESAIKDDSLTPLVVNRKLYRAHRQMRLAVVEASKRFEDQQFKRTRSELMAQHDTETKRPVGAGLVMRRGHRKELSTDAIRKIMGDRQSAHQTLVDTAVRRGGRGRRARKKTISDMSGMLLSISQDELNISNSGTPLNLESPPVPLLEKQATDGELIAKLHDIHKPEPTIPGKFRLTQDPFQSMRIALEEDVQHKKDVLQRSNNSMRESSSDGDLNLMSPATP